MKYLFVVGFSIFMGALFFTFSHEESIGILTGSFVLWLTSMLIDNEVNHGK